MKGFVYPIEIFPLSQKPIETELLNVIDDVVLKGTDFIAGNTCFNTTQCQDCSDCLFETFHFTIDGRELDLNLDWGSIGYNDSLIHMAWKGAPVATNRLRKPPNSIWGSDINFDTLKGSEQTDSFAELQAYHFLTLHAQFIRDLMGNQTFCFLDNCAPIQFFVNYQGMKIGSDYKSQIQSGLGKNATLPVMFTESTSYEDAYFAPRIPTNRTCSDGSCKSIETYPLTHIVFGQNESSDWALNSCLVFHELNHALVHRFIPFMPSFTWSDGFKSDPGALNEAWADYFAAIHCGISDFRKTYNGRPRRILDNQMTCKDMVGNVHTDSQIFSGALWQVRKGLDTVLQREFDKVVLKALMGGTRSDIFSTQLNAILTLLKNHSMLNSISETATRIFNERELACKRIKVVTETMDPTFRLPHPASTSANISMIPTVLKINARASDWAAQLVWRQQSVSVLGLLDSGYATTPLKIMISPCPIEFTLPEINGLFCTNTLLEWTSAKIGSFEFSLNSGVYLMIASDVPASLILGQMKITLIGFHRIWRCTLASLSLVFFLLLLVFIYKFVIQRGKINFVLPILSLMVVIACGVCSWFALFFGNFRDVLTLASFALWLIHVSLNWYIVRLLALPQTHCKLTLSSFLAMGSSTAIGLILALVPSSPLYAHTIVYTVFLGSILLNVTLVTLTMNPIIAPKQESDAISMHSLSSIK